MVRDRTGSVAVSARVSLGGGEDSSGVPPSGNRENAISRRSFVSSTGPKSNSSGGKNANVRALARSCWASRPAGSASSAEPNAAAGNLCWRE